MIIDPELDPNDESNYDDGENSVTDKTDEKAIEEFSEFFSTYGALPKWVVSHPDYIKRNKKNVDG